MTIIFEGPDLSGKTTLVKRVEKILGVQARHFGPPPKSRKEIINRIFSTTSFPLYDRHPCISEQIYGTMDGRSLLLPRRSLDILVTLLNPLIFYCNPGITYLKNNLIHLQKKSHKSAEHIDSVLKNYEQNYKKYEKIMNELRYDINVIAVDFRTVTDDFLKESIDEHYRH